MDLDLTLLGRLTFSDIAEAIDLHYTTRGSGPTKILLLEEQELALRAELHRQLRMLPESRRPKLDRIMGYPVEIQE